MTPMPQPTAYLAFDGNCAEAMHFMNRHWTPGCKP